MAPVERVPEIVGRRGIGIVAKLGGIAIMFGRFVLSLRRLHQSLMPLVYQLYFIGAKSLPLIAIISIFVGAVSAWQAAYQFKFIGAPLRYLGQAVGKAVVIELAPVLSAVVLAGRVGAGITAELGTMRVTEQIDALISMGISPVRYLVQPRIIACTLMVPFLVCFSIFVAILGGLIISMVGVDISSEMFLGGFKDSFKLQDFVNGLIKAAVFGFTIGLVSCYEGFHSEGGAQGVGLATTSSVVLSMVLILVFNFVFALILFRL